MAESIMLDKAKDFAVEIINMCKNIKETKNFVPNLTKSYKDCRILTNCESLPLEGKVSAVADG